MLKIAICDDDNFICADIEKTLLNYEKTCALKFEISVFYSGEEFIEFLNAGNKFDLVFLDIELGGISGIEVGSKIRNEIEDYISKIVFITAQAGYERELFKVQPMNFLPKPIDEAELIECVELAVKILNKDLKIFEYKVGRDMKKIEVKKILYFESSLKKIKIVMIDGEDYFYGSLNQIREKLPEYFLSPHGSFLVNYDYIAKITANEIHVTNGTVIPASRRHIKNIQKFQIQLARGKRNAKL